MRRTSTYNPNPLTKTQTVVIMFIEVTLPTRYISKGVHKQMLHIEIDCEQTI